MNQLIETKHPQALTELLNEHKTGAALLMDFLLQHLPKDVLAVMVKAQAAGHLAALETTIDANGQWQTNVTLVDPKGVRRPICSVSKLAH